jgi:aspartyl-tRNA(Asn)/glutamyl-tRNA(Gln) amidotransferase subunit A
MGVWHAASDAAGSIRIPAAFCGVHGFKPTFGVVPNYPASAFSGLGHHGPIAREVSDLAVMMSVMSRPDVRDATAAPAHLLDFAVSLEDGIRGTKIGYVRNALTIDPEVSEIIDGALNVFEGLGAMVEETALEFADAREQIESYWRVGCALIVDSVPNDLRFLLDPGLMEKGRQGHGISATEFRAFELKKEGLASDLNMTHNGFDLLVTPVVPIQPFPVEHDLPPGAPYGDWIDWTPFTYPFNLTQQPTAAIACGLTRSGLPTALQIVGPRFADMSILRAAKAYELACPRPELVLI